MAKYGILLTPDRHHIVAMKTTTASPADGDWDNQGNAIKLQSYGCESPIKSMWAVDGDAFVVERAFFDASDAGPNDPGGVWINDSDAFTDDLNEAACSTLGSSSSNYLEGEGTDSPASGVGGTIGSVQLRIKITKDLGDVVAGMCSTPLTRRLAWMQNGDTALILAVSSGRDACLTLLLGAGADGNAKNKVRGCGGGHVLSYPSHTA